MDGLTQLEQYKHDIKTLFFEYSNPRRTWSTVKAGKKIQYFQCNELYKMEALLECNPTWAFTLCADHHYTTRCAWDPRAREIGYVLEEFQTDDGPIYRLKDNVIQWIREHSLTLFWSATGKCTGIWVKPVDQKCFLIVICNEPITLDPLLIERIASDSFKFHEIYNPWKCETCYKMVPAHELYCRNCEKERYARCLDLACYEPQLKGAKVCWKCKQSLTTAFV